MNLYVWQDPTGAWCVGHRPPTRVAFWDPEVLLIALPDGQVPTFIDWKGSEEIHVRV